MNKKEYDKNPLEKPELKRHPFQVEDGYFDGLSERISNAIDAEESDLKYNLHLKKAPFKVPEGYFNELPGAIETKLTAIDRKEVKFYQRPMVRWLAVAASLALLITVYFNQPASKDSDLLSNVSDETIISFLESENALDDDLFVDLEEIDSVLDAIYADEIGIFVNTIGDEPELEYDFEYFDY